MQALGEPTEHGHGHRDVLIRIRAELAEIVVLGGHFLILHEGGEFGIRHADGFKQKRISRDMDGFHIREGCQHHRHFRRFEQGHVMLHIVRTNFNVRLSEETENLGEQISF